MVLREALGGGGAEQNPEHQNLSPDFVTADGVSTKKKRSSNRIWLQDSPEKALMTGGRFRILKWTLRSPGAGESNNKKVFVQESGNPGVLQKYRATDPRIRALSLVRGECTTALQSHGSKNPGS